MNHNGTMGEQSDGQGNEPSTVDSQEVDSVRYWLSTLDGLFGPLRTHKVAAVRPKAQNDLNRVMMRVKQTESGCWEWTGARSTNGYGRIKYSDGKRTFLALPHRVVAYAMGITDTVKHYRRQNQIVMHTCDNPKCCRPEHLAAGTMAENTADCVRKGRARWQRK